MGVKACGVNNVWGVNIFGDQNDYGAIYLGHQNFPGVKIFELIRCYVFGDKKK